MTTYNVIVFVHIVAAVVLVGGGLLATPRVHDAIRRATTLSELRRWLAIGRPLGRINPLSSLALLASGIYLASVGDWWRDAWVQVAVALWVINSILASVLVKPTMARLAQVAFAAEDSVVDRELDALRASPRLIVTSDVMLASDLGVLFLMVTKPSGYLMSVLVVIAAQVAMFALRFARPPVVATSTGSTLPAGEV